MFSDSASQSGSYYEPREGENEVDHDDAITIDDDGDTEMDSPQARETLQPGMSDVLRAMPSRPPQDHARGAVWVPVEGNGRLAWGPVGGSTFSAADVDHDDDTMDTAPPASPSKFGDLMRAMLDAKMARGDDESTPQLNLFNPFAAGNHPFAAGNNAGPSGGRRGSTGLTGSDVSSLTEIASQDGRLPIPAEVDNHGLNNINDAASDAGTLILSEPTQLYPRTKKIPYPKEWMKVVRKARRGDGWYKAPEGWVDPDVLGEREGERLKADAEAERAAEVRALEEARAEAEAQAKAVAGKGKGVRGKATPKGKAKEASVPELFEPRRSPRKSRS